jgi:transposase
MPKPYPKEFRQDVVRVARNREPGQTLKQIAADFGISESCLAGWITQPVPIPASRPTTSAEHRRPKGRTRDGVSSSYWHTTVKHLPGQDIVTMTPPLQLSLLAQGRPCGRPPAALRPGNDTSVTGEPASPSALGDSVGTVD